MKWGKRLVWLIILSSVCVTLVSLYYTYRNQPRPLELTAAELHWLENHGSNIRYAPHPDSPPLDYVDEGGNHLGLTSDYIHLIEEQLGIRFIQVQCKSWKEITEKLEAGEIDMVGSIQSTVERREYLRFTKPYERITTVILVNEDNPKRYTLNNMRSISIAVVDGSATYDYVKKKHPEYIFVPVEEAGKGADFLAFKQVDAMITDIGVASYCVNERGISNLKVGGYIDFPWDLRLASRRDRPFLNSILDKALATITPEQENTIHDKWLGLDNTMMVPTERLFRIVGLLLLITLLAVGSVIFWNRILKKQVRHRTHELGRVRHSHQQTARALGESEERFARPAQPSANSARTGRKRGALPRTGGIVERHDLGNGSIRELHLRQSACARDPWLRAATGGWPKLAFVHGPGGFIEAPAKTAQSHGQHHHRLRNEHPSP